jgi:opacity protein-like surface antigen
MKPLVLLIAATLAAHAGEPYTSTPMINPGPERSGWEFTTALYAPLMGLEGDIGVAGFAPSHVDIPFEDIWDNLDGSLSGAFEARYDRWSITADAIWLKLSTATNPIASSYLSVSQEQIMASLSVGYEIYGNESTTVDVVVGAALNSLDVDLELFTPNLPVTTRSGSGSQEWIDPFVGLRFHQRLGDRWSLFANGLYGGFDVSSDEYWQVLAGIGYRLTENTSIALAYRVIAVDYQQGGFAYDTETSGPNLGLIIRF